MATMKERLFEIMVNSMVSNVINIGNRLNLFKSLARISSAQHPVYPRELAKESGCKERYIREWCNCLACARIIEVNADEQFWIASENVEELTSNDFALISHAMVPMLVEPIEKLIDSFKINGPLGLDYCEFSKFQDFMSQMSESMHEKHMINDLLPLFGDNFIEKLKTGGLKIIDIACGQGYHVSVLAEQFPKNQFIGLDIDGAAIRFAKNRTKKDGTKFENLEFIEHDACRLNQSWSDQFDIVLIFDACHDQMRPDLCLKGIHRILKPNGLFAMLEIFGSSNVFDDRNSLGVAATMGYGCSMFHCLPVGSNHQEALCLGTMWGRKRAVQLLKECGFEDVKVVETPFFQMNLLYLSRKA